MYRSTSVKIPIQKILQIFQRNRSRWSRAAIYTGANTSGTPLGAGPVDVYIDSTDNSKPYTGDFVSKYWGENGRQNALKISAQTFGLSSAELTASKYTIAILGVYDYTYNYSYLADSAQNLSNYENQLPFETGSTTYYSVSYDEKVPDFPSPLTSGVTVTPITNAKANSYLQERQKITLRTTRSSDITSARTTTTKADLRTLSLTM